MDREHFIILVYCLICEHYQVIVRRHSLRRPGFANVLSDEEVMTIEICGEYFGFSKDEAIYDYFRAHWQHFIPKLKERTSFVRQAANLWQVKAMMQKRLTLVIGQAADPVQTIDTLPLPVCTYTRSQGDGCFKPRADYGYCAERYALLRLQTGTAHLPSGYGHSLSAATGPTT